MGATSSVNTAIRVPHGRLWRSVLTSRVWVERGLQRLVRACQTIMMLVDGGGFQIDEIVERLVDLRGAGGRRSGNVILARAFSDR
jgi:hypothetical protein